LIDEQVGGGVWIGFYWFRRIQWRLFVKTVGFLEGKEFLSLLRACYLQGMRNTLK